MYKLAMAESSPSTAQSQGRCWVMYVHDALYQILLKRGRDQGKGWSDRIYHQPLRWVVLSW